MEKKIATTILYSDTYLYILRIMEKKMEAILYYGTY